MKKVESFFGDGTQREYPNKQIILYQGEKAHDIYQIKSGYIKAYNINSQGTEQLLLILGPGDIYPLIWSYKKPPISHYFYETIGDTAISVISREDFFEKIDGDHVATKELLYYFAEQWMNLMSRLETIEASDASHKVKQVFAYLTLAHANRKVDGKARIKVQLTQQHVADMAGVTRETANVQIRELMAAKICEYDKDGLFVVDSKALNKAIEKS